MSGTLLDALKTMTTIVADTGDLQSIEQFVPRDATTNPSLITAAAAMPAYADVVDEALREARAATTSREAAVARASDRLGVAFGLRILKIVPGRVSTEVDARLSYDADATYAKAKELIAAYEAAGVDKGRVLVKIAATWEGIRAAERLEREGIHCNLTLLFGFHQAVACAEANVTLISPFVGRILDWHKKTHGRDFVGAEDPGVQSVTRIYNYYKAHGYRTEVMGASFRNTGEILELAGCDLLTIAPKLLAELQGAAGALPRKLDPAAAAGRAEAKISLDERAFRAMHEEDAMAKEKLAEGIDGFAKALVELEGKLAARLETLP